MYRLIFGIFFLLIGLLIKMLFGHLAEKWATVGSVSFLLYVIGFTVLFYKLLTKSENRKGIEFKKNPIKWIFKRPFFIYALVIPIILGLLWTGQFLNDELKNYYLENEVAETKATFIRFEEQSFLLKFRKKSETFAILEYNTNKGIVTQGLKKKEFNKNKRYFKLETNNKNIFPTNENLKYKKATIIYSLKHPSFFKIKE